MFDVIGIETLPQGMTLALNRRSLLGGLIALPACQASGSKFDAEIIIIGAGLAGLRAAQLLTAQGKDVLVLEGSDRIGGRVVTHYHGDAGFTEGGGAKIHPSDSRLITLAAQMDIALKPYPVTPPTKSYYYDGQLRGPEFWNSQSTPLFPLPFDGLPPRQPLKILAQETNVLKTDTDWLKAEFQSYDISVQDFLSARGFNGDAQNLIAQSFDGNSLRNHSMMNIYRTTLYKKTQSRGSYQRFAGGAATLPAAMAASLPRKVNTGQVVSAIAVETDKVAITTAKGKTFTAERCICALPFGALRNIAIKAFMPEAQSQAIRELPHTQILQFHIQSRNNFWDKDGLPADMWTDLPVEQIIAHRDTSGVPTGLFRVLINGRGATRSVWEDRDQSRERLRTYLKTVRPASDGQFDVLKIDDWTRGNPLAGGAYTEWAPGQIRQWARDMGQGSRQLIFAGDHLSQEHLGMEGALDSAERAAESILR